jgi:DNA-binding transcriptional regulator GbsR (MarR family)
MTTLSNIGIQFITHWGEMGEKWGVNRTVAQIHALLFFIGKPLPADEITETLGVARSNVSNSIKELQNWNLVQLVHVMGERRDHFTTASDPWELLRIIVKERQEREINPTIKLLNQLTKKPEFLSEDQIAQARIKECLGLMEALTTWSDEMLRLDKSSMKKILKLGASVSKFIRPSKKFSKENTQ